MIRKSLLAVGCIAVLAACGLQKHSDSKVEEMPKEETVSVPSDGSPSQADVDRVKDKFPGYRLSQLNEGKVLYENNCALCHDLVEPIHESEEGWRRIVPEMVVKANKKNGNTLDPSGEEKILRYVITMGPELGR